MKGKAQVVNLHLVQEETSAKKFKTIVAKYPRKLLKMKLTIITITTTKNMSISSNKTTMEEITEMETQVVAKTWTH